MHDLKNFFLVKVVCICLKYQNPNRQPDHSTFTIYHNMLLIPYIFQERFEALSFYHLLPDPDVTPEPGVHGQLEEVFTH